jgi:hypothetical protein
VVCACMFSDAAGGLPFRGVRKGGGFQFLNGVGGDRQVVLIDQ